MYRISVRAPAVRARAISEQYTKAGRDLWQLDADAAGTFNSVVHGASACATNSRHFIGLSGRFTRFAPGAACCSLLRVLRSLHFDGACLREREPYGGARAPRPRKKIHIEGRSPE
ncbi:hypothetical protein [Paraburkholderia bannensis]|uniref:hypothetical protein n=1 Tax=Paraburkholderia bannensis TaxID=765414 RepID=UPI002ABD22DD|nr:hypothetical protein [Paraburkholderia bannensis]